MAEGDLCTTNDVKNEIYILRATTEYDTVIEERITKFSADIKDYAGDLTLTIDNTNAKNACIYRVCTWLESQDIVPAMKRLVGSESEGDVSRSYIVNQKTIGDVIPNSYEEMYWFYLHRLLPSIAIGCIIPVEEDDPGEEDRVTFRGAD